MRIQAKMRETLETIRSTPELDRSEMSLDPVLLEDLRSQGLIEASVFKAWDRGNIYSNMRLTITGEQYLELLDSAPEESERSAPAWYLNPFLIAALGVVGSLFVVGVAYHLGWR